MPTLRTLLALLLTFALVATACGDDDDTAADEPTEAAGGEGASITVYSGRGEDLVGPLVEQFTADTGIEAEVRYGDSAEMLLLIQEEGDNSPADVFFSQGAGFLGTLAEAGGLSPLDPAILELVPEQLQSPDGNWVGTSGRARTVVYNTETLTEADLPDSIVDFTDPAWEGRIGYAPTNGSFQDFVTALRALVGEDAAREWLEGILANNPVPYDGNTAIVEAVAAGEVEVGFVNHYYLYRYLAEDPDFPAANKYFDAGDPGALVNIAGAGIVATTDQPDAAATFVEYLLSESAQQFFVEETFEIPVVEGIESPPEVPALDAIGLPDFDLNLLLDLQGTVDLLTEVGAL
jgi:iron(III) transport system substrate-binding protein